MDKLLVHSREFSSLRRWSTALVECHVHTHIILLGFMAMMVYGVGYHILPRFMGRPVFSQRLGYVHVWLANITLVGLSVSWILETSH